MITWMSLQEPLDTADIQAFVKKSFDYTPELYGKIDVNGEEADPLWVFLKKVFFVNFSQF